MCSLSCDISSQKSSVVTWGEVKSQFCASICGVSLQPLVAQSNSRISARARRARMAEAATSQKRRRVTPGLATSTIGNEQSRRNAGHELLKKMLALYAEQKISAQAFCQLCWFANEAAVPGGDFALYAQAPGKSSGSYQDTTFLQLRLVT